MWLRHHAQAEQTGARIVHSCGFDSIPYDLGALFTVEQLPDGVPIKLDGFVSAGATFSGGTYHSAIHGAAGTPHRDSVAGGWVVPFPTIDPQTVLRSARALDRYGPDFTYTHYLVAGSLLTAVGLAGGAGALIALAHVPPARKLLLKLKDPGDGPSPEQSEKGWFRVRFLGVGGDRRVVPAVSGGDPGYGETSKMLAESALCLAHDQLPERGGQLTPAVAMGDALTRRLERAGINFTVVES